MRANETLRHRSGLLARWRDSAAVAPGTNDPVASLAVDASAVEGPHRTAQPSALSDEGTLLRQLEEELLNAVGQPTTDTLLRLLAAPSAALLAERSPEHRQEMLAQLDVLEDVLDALLLTGAPQGAAAEDRIRP
jgi:hypothetical protein